MAISICKFDFKYIDAFELGYLISFFNLATKTNVLFFKHYKGRLIQQFNYLINKIKYIRCNWIIEIYIKYLYFLNSHTYCKFSKINFLDAFYYQKSICKMFAITINFDMFFYHTNILNIINKLSFINEIKNYIFSVFDIKTFIATCELLKLSEIFVVFKKKIGIINNVLHLFILNLIYEVNKMFYVELNIHFDKRQKLNLFIVNDKNSILIISQNMFILNFWNKCLLSCLSSYGFNLINRKNMKLFSLDQGIDLKNYFISIIYHSIINNVCIKPSLYYQFLLLKLINALMFHSVSKILFLSIIRLNKLLLSWSSYYMIKKPIKVFCLLDYLILIKFNFLVRHQNIKLIQKKVCFSYAKLNKSNKYFIKKSSNIAIVSNRLYYRQYVVLKLLWLS